MVVTKLHNLIIISMTGLLGSPSDVIHTILGGLGWGGAIKCLGVPPCGNKRVSPKSETILMHNPPHPGAVTGRQCVEPLGLTVSGI